MKTAKQVGKFRGLNWTVSHNGQVVGRRPQDGVMVYRFYCANPPEDGTGQHELFTKVCRKAVKAGILRQLMVFALV